MTPDDYQDLADFLEKWCKDDRGPALTWDEKSTIQELVERIKDWHEDVED